MVLTPEYEGRATDRSLGIYDEIANVFFIEEVTTDTLLATIEEFEEGHCL